MTSMCLGSRISTRLHLMKNLSGGCKRDSSFCGVTVLHEGFCVGNNPLDASMSGRCKQQPWAGVQHLHECVISIHFLKAQQQGSCSIFTTSLNLLGDEILIDVEVLCVVHSWVKLCWPALRWWIGKHSSFALDITGTVIHVFQETTFVPTWNKKQIPHALGKLYDKADMLLKITSH